MGDSGKYWEAARRHKQRVRARFSTCSVCGRKNPPGERCGRCGWCESCGFAHNEKAHGLDAPDDVLRRTS